MGDNVRGDRVAPEPVVDGAGVRIGVVCGRFNDAITGRLLAGANEAIAEFNVADGAVIIEWVPGAYELPFAARTLIESGKVDAVVALGAVIRGETSHYDFVAGECARGLQDVQLTTGVPVIFGVLTTEDVDQALARSQPKPGHNVGRDGVQTAIEMVQLLGKYPKASRSS